MHDIDLMLKLQIEGKNKEARAISDKLEKIGPDKILDVDGTNTQDVWFRHSFNRGWFILQDGDYQKGSQLLEHGRFLNVYGSPRLKTEAPIFNPKQHKLKNKSILVSLEGGYGDEIIHSRFATSFKKNGAGKVFICCSADLVPVFSCIDGVDEVFDRKDLNKIDFDYWVPGFSAGWLASHTFENFPNEPYLKPREDFVKKWKEKIKSDKIKVGIRWAGNPKFEHQQFRRFPEAFMTNLSKYPELQVYSLQRDDTLLNLSNEICDLKDSLECWDDTMGAIENLDLVITSCTSVAHLSAAMGKTTWVVTPILPYHTWTPGAPESTKTPFYKSVDIYRQKVFKKWNDPFQKLYSDLEKKFNLKHIEMPDEDKERKKLSKLFYSYDMSVDMAYIIRVKNHEKSEALAKQCSDSCDRVGMPWQYWDGYDATGSEIIPPDHHNEIMEMMKVSDHYMRKGELANCLNHVSLWAKCILEDKPIVILEHDAIMVKPYRFHSIYNSICYLGGKEQVKKNWDVLPTPPHGSDGNNYHFILRTHAYAIDPAVAKNMLSYILRQGIHGASDIMIRADLFPMHQTELFAYDQDSESIILNRPKTGRPAERNEDLKY